MKPRALALALLLCPLPLVGQARLDTTRASPSRARLFAEDFRVGLHLTTKTLERPLRWSRAEWVAVPAAAVALVTLSGADEPVHGAFDRNRSAGIDHVLTVVEPLGSEGALATVVGVYFVGLGLNVPGLRRAGVEA